MKSFLMLCLLSLVVFVSLCAGATAVPVPAAVAVVAAAPVGFLDWFRQNTPAVLAVALALSELLSLIPAFAGNGILDTISKALKAMTRPPA